MSGSCRGVLPLWSLILLRWSCLAFAAGWLYCAAGSGFIYLGVGLLVLLLLLARRGAC